MAINPRNFVLIALLTVVLMPMSSAGNLIAYWPFDEGAGSVAQDSSGNGHHGTLHNVDWATGVSGSGLALHGEGVQFESFATGSHVSTPLRLSIDRSEEHTSELQSQS